MTNTEPANSGSSNCSSPTQKCSDTTYVSVQDDIGFTANEEDKSTADDAKAYAKAMDENAMLQICALYSEEGPSKGSQRVDQCTDLLKETILDDLYQKYTACLDNIDISDEYDVAYAKEIEYYLPGGLLRGEKSICHHCAVFLRSNKKKKSDLTDHTGSTSTSSDLAGNKNLLPKDALILGLFQGSIPPELFSLNLVELSMVSLYSSISRISLNGGKNYTMSGATTYTIVNDVTTIASRLPRFPTLETTAIMRHANSRKLKDYVFRLFYVKSALMWLIANNHLYKDIVIDYTTDQDWDDSSASTAVPFE